MMTRGLMHQEDIAIININTKQPRCKINETKAVPRGKFIMIQAFLKKQEKPQVNNLTYHLKELEEEQQAKPKVSRRKEIIKIREQINKIEIKNNRKGSSRA